MENEPNRPRRRRLWQFSLRTFLIVSIVIGVLVSLGVRQYHAYQARRRALDAVTNRWRQAYEQWKGELLTKQEYDQEYLEAKSELARLNNERYGQK